MAAFEKVKSGIEGLDAVFDYIRIGDNVVWQLTTLADFSQFVDPFVTQALDDGRTLVYIRFANHEPLVQARDGITVYELNPHHGFETFTVEVRDIITKEGYEALYVFDCLSELQAAWSADMMMGNFFRVTCPYLFELDTIAYFPIIRGMHSFETIAKIRETTQLLIDVVHDEDCLFIHPLKVWNRYSQSMFLAHRFDPITGKVTALRDSVETSRFYSLLNQEEQATPDRNSDSWDRFFLSMRMAYDQGALPADACSKMCNMMMTKDREMRDMVLHFFEPQDFFEVRGRMVGTGLIGGKACGMLLARKIIEHSLPHYRCQLEPHDSFYIGSDVFYSYIVASDLWRLRIEQRSIEGFFESAPVLQEGLMNGAFPEDIRERFRRMLEYFGQNPIIVRSSSFLEDGFGNAFAGKYESVFCANVGTPSERLAAFEDAVRTVYASTMDESALEYRLRNGLDKQEEQMALLVQRVSGSHHGSSLFMPTAAGVGYSYSLYRLSGDIDPQAGMLRLVVGLGTKAVERTTLDYPRIIGLDRPLANTHVTFAEKHRFSQHYADVLDLEQRKLREISVQELIDALSPNALRAVYEHDMDAEYRLRETGHYRPVLFASCLGLAQNALFTTMMRDILQTLHEAYRHAVDIEFTVNVGESDSFMVNLLQCRPLQALGDDEDLELPKLPQSDIYFHLRGSTMGKSRKTTIDTLVVVDPRYYYSCQHSKKSSIARMIGAVNLYCKKTERQCLFITPGRIGTSSPELGVPVSFADISVLKGVCEVAYSAAGYSPELSFGSHLFQDLVEADIYYGAILENSDTLYFDSGFPSQFTDITQVVLSEFLGDSEIQDIVKLYDASESGLTLWHDLIGNESICGLSQS
ncbi:MAG: phosphoenolpyruvate synthase [Coriobacteriaceae bacterium]|nr:phosphoenolpyruvate synthase [Coriobacteriaceae bacterium]